MIATVKKLRRLPDVLLVNGCGINYPRFAGLASHVGVILGMPTVGVSKKTLCGQYIHPAEAGSSTKLAFNGKSLGFVLKTVVNAKLIFISPGNLVSFMAALRIVQRCIVSHRLPEPLRLARIKARRLRPKSRTNGVAPL